MGRIVENRKTNFQAAHDLDVRQALRELSTPEQSCASWPE